MRQKVFCYIGRFQRGRPDIPELLVMTSLEEPGYEVPKGSVEHGETLESAAHREALEETGIKSGLRLISELGVTHYQDEEQHFYLMWTDDAIPERFAHIVTGDGGDRGTEYQYRWVQLSEDLSSMLVQGSDAFVDALREAIPQSARSSKLTRHRRRAWSTWLHRSALRIWSQKWIPFWMKNLVQWILLPKYLAGVVGLVYDDQWRVLLVHHTYRLGCAWGPPGGWIKAGEDPTQALEREIYEETGFRVWVEGAVAIGGDKSLRRLDLYYRCKYLNGTFIPNAEVSEADFYAFSDLPDDVEPFHREVITYAAARELGNTSLRFLDRGAAIRSEGK